MSFLATLVETCSSGLSATTSMGQYGQNGQNTLLDTQESNSVHCVHFVHKTLPPVYEDESPYQKLCRLQSQGQMSEAELDEWRVRAWMPFNEDGQVGIWCVV